MSLPKIDYGKYRRNSSDADVTEDTASVDPLAGPVARADQYEQDRISSKAGEDHNFSEMPANDFLQRYMLKLGFGSENSYYKPKSPELESNTEDKEF